MPRRPRPAFDLSSASVLLITLLVITFVVFIGQTLFNTKGEPREAIVAMSMLQQGDWILPVSCGGDIPYKPPFMAWCIAILSWLNGGVVNEFISRLPSALAMIVMTVIVMRFFAKRVDLWTGMATALILMTSFEVHRAATNCRVDMILTMFIVTGLLQLLRYREQGHRGISWIAVLLMSGGVLTKGPVGMLLPCMVIFVYRLMRGDGFWRVLLVTAASGLLACVLPAIWYVAAYHEGGETFLRLAMEENFGRFMGTMTYESHVNPPSYNFVALAAGLLPYTLLLLFALFGALRWPWPAKAEGSVVSRFWHWLRNMDDTKLYSLLSALLIFVFYCIPKSKRSVYLLPVYPFIAYYIALAARWLCTNYRWPVKAYGWVLASLGAIVPPLFLAIKVGWLTLGGRTGEMLEAVRQLPLPIACALVLAAMLPAALWAMREYVRADAIRSFNVTLGLTLIIYWGFSAVLQPSFLNIKSDYPLACKVKEYVPEGDVYSFVDDPYLRFYTVNFYLDDRVKLIDKALPSEGFVMVGERDLPVFMERLGERYDLTEVFFSDKKSCDLKQPIHFYRLSQKPQAEVEKDEKE